MAFHCLSVISANCMRLCPVPVQTDADDHKNLYDWLVLGSVIYV
jgi:hypothetical protein